MANHSSQKTEDGTSTGSTSTNISKTVTAPAADIQSDPQSEMLEPEPQQPIKEIDLNALFPENEKDLNDLFPEEELRVLLKKINKNREDMAMMHQRFQDELQLTEEKEIDN